MSRLKLSRETDRCKNTILLLFLLLDLGFVTLWQRRGKKMCLLILFIIIITTTLLDLIILWY